jgi:2'-5' RNA ligase
VSDGDVVGVLNRTLRQGEQRARDLEDRFVAVIEAELDFAADAAADNFQSLAVDHLRAAAALREQDMEAVHKMGLGVAQRLVASMGLNAAIDVKTNSTMVALKPRIDEAEAVADGDGYPAENLHVTLCYLGEIDGDLRPVADALAAVAATHAPLVGIVGGYGQFSTPDGPVGILLPDVPGLIELRVCVADALMQAGVDYARNHGFTPHMTVDDEPEPGELEEMLPLSGQALHFDSIHLVRGDREEIEIPLVGMPALTAAAAKPYCLPAGLRGKTDAVRREVIRTMMKAALEGAGLSFDVSNPLVARILARAASQITHISRTTQLDVMRIIRAAYEEGLSIDDTAKAIRAQMKEANPARARLIARTELAGAVNGGSLSAAQIVSNATGVALYKQWLTAMGAKHPRHHKYIGLSGQTRKLDEYFQVGRAALEHPGDPSGPGEEVCNCRCSMIYTDDPSKLYGLLASVPVPENDEVYHSDHAAMVTTLLAKTVEALTAAGPGWSSPDPDQILNINCGTTYSIPRIASRQEAIDYYHSPKAFELNAALRSGKELTAEQESIRRALDLAFEEAGIAKTLWRGAPDAVAIFGKAVPKKGQIVDWPGYSSTSASEDVADVFATGIAGPGDRPVLMRISVPSDMPLLRIPAGDYGDQDEWLMPRGLRLRVDRVTHRDGADVVWLSVITRPTVTGLHSAAQA